MSPKASPNFVKGRTRLRYRKKSITQRISKAIIAAPKTIKTTDIPISP
jgi:hypothetical protein